MYETYKTRILAFYKRARRMPSYSEILQVTGLKSKNAVFKIVQKLIEEGIVSKDNMGKLIPRHISSDVKVLGTVEAGFPSPAEEELVDVMNFDEFLVPNKESTYILKVKGDSMIDAGIHEGDMVVVERKSTYKPGQIVIAVVDSEYTMKYLRRKNDAYYLEPANAKYKLIYPRESFRIEAMVTAVVRKY